MRGPDGHLSLGILFILIAIINLSPNRLALNLTLFPRLQAKWVVPPDILESAAIVIDAKRHRTEKARPPHSWALREDGSGAGPDEEGFK